MIFPLFGHLASDVGLSFGSMMGVGVTKSHSHVSKWALMHVFSVRHTHTHTGKGPPELQQIDVRV